MIGVKRFSPFLGVAVCLICMLSCSSGAQKETLADKKLGKIKLEIPKGATEIVLPQNEKIVLFAATAVQDELPEIQITSQLYQTAIKE